jgi:hypothetical protein
VGLRPLAGRPRAARRAVRARVWQRDDEGHFRRVYAGVGPARSEALGAWIVVTGGGWRLRVADDAEGRALWPTEAEEAQAEVARLRAEVERLRGG